MAKAEETRYEVRVSPASGYREIVPVQPGQEGYEWAEPDPALPELRAAVGQANALLRRRTRGDLSRF